MSDKYVPNLGKSPQDGAVRDAVHIAVFPATVVGKYGVYAGNTVKLVFGTQDECMECAHDDADCIGVVDPFVIGSVDPGERVWVFLRPNTITYLRHHWEHPAFDKPITASESEIWLRRFANSHSISFIELIDALESKHDYDWRVIASNDLSRSDVESELRELWKHAEKYLNKPIDQKQRESFGFGFSCSC